MADDISKKTLAVLLVFAIAISFIGTWVVMSQSPDVVNVGVKKNLNHPVDTGRINLNVGPLPGTIDTSNVGLRII